MSPAATSQMSQSFPRPWHPDRGEKFSSLWEGDIPVGVTHSEADQALCTILAFWCGGDTDQMDRLFRESGLMREKWDREDYRTATLNKAVAMTTEFYKPLNISDAKTDFSTPAAFLSQVCPENNPRYPWTEIGYGRLFADCYRNIARFVPERKSWYCYRDGIWAADVGNLQTMELCKELADALMIHALTIQNEQKKIPTHPSGVLQNICAASCRKNNSIR